VPIGVYASMRAVRDFLSAQQPLQIDLEYPQTPPWVSVLGTALGRLLAPASGLDCSFRAVGPHIEMGPKCVRSTVLAFPVRILVRESDHPGGTERARRSPAPASQCAVMHNHAPRGRVTGSQSTRNRRSVWPLESRIGHAGADRDAEASGSGLSQGRQTLASRKLHTQPTDGQRSKPWS
jgi:hypothetical protein